MKTQSSQNPRQWINSFMDGCHEMVLNHLRPQIQEMFENCSVALLEFSEKAQSSASQIRFMEAGTIITNQREKVEAVFYHELQKGFTQFKHPSHRGAAIVPADITDPGNSEEQLTLISKEDSDNQVAIQNMVASASLGSMHELTAIRQRLAVLNNGRKLREQQIPAGPDALASAFYKAAGELPLEHELKLIVYLLFDKFVLSNSAPLYAEYNKRLLKAGLLQNLKYEARKYPKKLQPWYRTPEQAAEKTGRYSPATGRHAAHSNQSLGDELFDSILKLMSRRQPHAEHPPAKPVPQAVLVSAIHRLQQNSGNHDAHTRAAATSASTVASEQDIANMVENLSSERKQLFRGIDRRQLPAADTQLIDLVGMMFEYMLNDDEIPYAAKAELSRLHTPYLKVAIIDKTFFTDNTHPANELLNELARASTRWVFEDNLERGVFPCMRKIVTRIIRDFNNNLDIFLEMLEMLHVCLHDLDNRAFAIEVRSRQAAEGREKLELARQCAASTIEEAVRSQPVPGAIRQMLGDVWRDKLMFIYLREPEADRSDSWRLATQTIESILWCVEPRITTEQQRDLRALSPYVHTQLKQSLDTLSAYGASDVVAEFALIKEFTEAAINPADLFTTAVIDNEGTDEATQSDPQPEADTNSDEPVQTLAQQSTETHSDSPVVAKTAADTAHPEAVVDDAEGQAESYSKADDLTPETAAKLAELNDVPFGSWFSIRKDTMHIPVRAKLSWYSGISGNYMFVNGMGIKVAVFKRRELAELLASGQAEILHEEEHPLIQRALQAIRRMLGSDQTVHA